MRPCEPKGFDDVARSLAAGSIQTNNTSLGSICDAIVTPAPGDITFPILARNCGSGLVASDDDCLFAMAAAFARLKLVIEPGGAVALASALKHKDKLEGDAVVVVTTGGNVDPAVFMQAIDRYGSDCMTDFTIATFNVKNLIGPDKEYYRFEKYTPEEYAWKRDWLADQLLSLDADVVCLQEVFERDALADVVRETNARAEALNADVIPDPGKRYAKKAIFRKLGVKPYPFEGIEWVGNVNDGEPGQRRPGLAILSRNGFVGEVEVIQDLPEALEIRFPELGGLRERPVFTVCARLSRPIMKARVPAGNAIITIFNIHFKSKLGEFLRPADADFAPEADLTNYDAYGRAVGELRSALRRMAEATVLRRLILD